MFQNLRVKRQREKYAPELERLPGDWLARNPNIPTALRQINGLPENAKKRIYRALVPPTLLGQFRINPVTWQGPDDSVGVLLTAEAETGMVRIALRRRTDPSRDVFYLELEDTSMNGINLNFLLIRDPDGPCFRTDHDEEGNPSLFGAVRRNLAAEEQAMKAGLTPAQECKGLRASQQVLQHLEAFLVTHGHTAYFLEPLTYASAWLFERRGFAYVRGHKLMDEIDREFRPGGRLHRALDGSTPFRQPEQWSSVRGRAWAIHDGILEAIGATWDGLRMIKQVGRHAGVETFDRAVY